MQYTKNSKYFKSKDRIKKIKNFRWFVLTVLMASVYMIGFSAFLYYTEAEDSFVPITIYLWSTLGLWIILLFEYLKIFRSKSNFLKEWEEKQLQKYMSREQNMQKRL